MIVAGRGGFGREVAQWVRHVTGDFAGFLDDIFNLGSDCLGPIVGHIPNDRAVYLIAISKPEARERVAEMLASCEFPATGFGYHHIVAASADVDYGTIMCPYSVISNNALVGKHVHVNISSSIGHDAVVGDFCTISSHVDICGNVTLGKRVFVGSHATIMPGVTVGDDAVIGAGCVVVNNVEPGVTMYSQPARRM